MKPLNYAERKQIFIRFLMISLVVLGLFGYSIYSYVFVKEEITVLDETNTDEVEALENFMEKARKEVELFRAAESDSDRSMHNLELSSLIRENGEKFSTHKQVFFEMGETYKDWIKASERLASKAEKSTADCDEIIEQFETQIEEYEEEIKMFQEREEEIAKAKSGLQVVLNEIVQIGNEIPELDWCNGPGNGKDEIKNDLRQRIKSTSKEMTFRMEDL